MLKLNFGTSRCILLLFEAKVGFLSSNVSFSYPGASKEALKGVSFTIKPGQMVIIVGENGSGKTSLMKLFNRMYDPDRGQILLDGLPLQSYKLSDLRNAMAILRQDHTPYPLSLRENIALGLPRHETTTLELEDAAQKGGALGFIEKLDNKMETILHPEVLSRTYFPKNPIKELKAIVEGKQRRTNLSGGESQRLAV